MFKRAFAASLWFAATWFGYEIAWSLTDVPRIAGPFVAFAVAALVTLDPLSLFWPRSAQRDGATSRSIQAGLDSPATPAH
jgi:hypothetical protein